MAPKQPHPMLPASASLAGDARYRQSRYWTFGTGASALPGEPPGAAEVNSVMKNDPIDDAIDEILASANGDVRAALRAVLVENIQLVSELRSLYAATEHGRRTDPRKTSLH
jgi:hypothetical protein